MKILYLVPYIPSPVRVRSYNLVRTLARRGHAVTLATLWSNRQDQENLAELESLGIELIPEPISQARSLWNCTRNFSCPLPLQAVYAWQPRLMDRVLATWGSPKTKGLSAHRRNLSRSVYDVIHVEHLRGARYAEILKGFLRTVDDPTPIIWDSVDCISSLFEQTASASRVAWSRLVSRRELARTRWYEAWLVQQFDRVLVTSDQDRSAFIDLLNEFAPGYGVNGGSSNRLCILPNGVHLDYFAPLDLPRKPRTILFSGKMSYHANVTAALHLVQDVMPIVWEKFPNACVQIVGEKPPLSLIALAARFPGRVMVTGTVDDLRTYLAQATLAVAPLMYGTGIQNKVLEALAMETPLVATSKAIAALNVQHERELLVGDSPEELAGAITRLLRNIGLRERLKRNGRAYVELHHDWMDITAELEAIYQETTVMPSHPN